MMGGAHGGDIEGAVNVTVLTPTMAGLQPKSGAMVWLGLHADTEYVGFTNGAGTVGEANVFSVCVQTKPHHSA